MAIPHGRLKEISQPVAAFIQLDNAIEYDALDQKPVDLIFGLLVPEDSTEEHLQILAKLASLFSDSGLVNRLREGDSPEKLYETLNN